MMQTIIVKINDKKILEWNDNSNIDCPEDLSWNRRISDIFWKGVEPGCSTKHNSEIKIDYEEE